jgi:DNA-binding transcriptional LysR family regulator
MPQILELQKHFKHLELKFMRGDAAQVAEFMKSGEAELAVASSLGEAWDRLDRWPLFRETFILVTARDHRLAGSPNVSFADLIEEPILMGTACEHFGGDKLACSDRLMAPAIRHSLWSIRQSFSEASMRVIPTMIGLAFVMIAPQAAFAWGDDGHKTIALIAQKCLTPNTATTVARCWARTPTRSPSMISPTRRPGPTNIAT